MKDASTTLITGDAAPAFELPTAHSDIVRLSAFRGSCVLIIFVRGTW